MKKIIRLTDNEGVKNGFFTFINPFTYYQLRRSSISLGDFDGVFIDGVLLCWILRFLGYRVSRVSFDFTSLAGPMLAYAQSSGQQLYVVGSTQDNVEKAGEVFQVEFPRLKLSGLKNGYLKADEYGDLIQSILNSNTSLVIAGMGALKQEEFLLRLKAAGFGGLAFTCGGFLHQTADKKGTYYPDWVDRANIRWVYRIYKEPKLLKRYMFIYPIAVALFLFDIAFKKIEIELV